MVFFVDGTCFSGLDSFVGLVVDVGSGSFDAGVDFGGLLEESVEYVAIGEITPKCLICVNFDTLIDDDNRFQ